MSTPIIPWNGDVLGDGPVALSTDCADTEEIETLLVKSPSSPVCSVSVSQVGTLLERHGTRLFVSADVATLHRQLLERLPSHSPKKSRDALWSLTRNGRWVDLQLLDRQIRHAKDARDYRIRPWAEIVAACSPVAGDTDPGAENLGFILSVFDKLQNEARNLEEEARPVPPPRIEFPPRTPEEEAAIAKRFEALSKALRENRQRAGANKWSAPPDTREEDQPLGQQPSLLPIEVAPLGNRVEVWAAVSLCNGSPEGFLIDRNRLPELRTKATERYRKASAILFKNPEQVRNCFKWDIEQIEVQRPNGYPETRPNRIGLWLRDAYDRLCDIHGQPPDVPLNENGRPSLNPEHWGFWPACDDALWAWRDLYRMAELARVAEEEPVVDDEPVIRPRYEIAPLLRSREPNLAVRRRTGGRLPALRRALAPPPSPTKSRQHRPDLGDVLPGTRRAAQAFPCRPFPQPTHNQAARADTNLPQGEIR